MQFKTNSLVGSLNTNPSTQQCLGHTRVVEEVIECVLELKDSVMGWGGDKLFHHGTIRENYRECAPCSR